MIRRQDYSRPGIVRELENVIERAVINSSGPKLHLADDLPGRLTKRCRPTKKPARDRKGSHHPGARGNQLAHRRTQRRRRDSGYESFHPALSHAQTGDSKTIRGLVFWVQRSEVLGSEVPFALRAAQGRQGSAQPPAKKMAGLIEKETWLCSFTQA